MISGNPSAGGQATGADRLDLRWRRIAVAFAALTLIAIVRPSLAQSEPDFPSLTGRIVDAADLLDAALERQLDSTLTAHEAESSNQLVVVTLPTLQGYDIADYANRLGRHWQIGTAENDNGVLLVVAPKEREVRIEVGYGLEGALTDATSRIIIEREILPAFREGDYSGGVDRGTRAIIEAMDGEYEAAASGGTRSKKKGVSTLIGNVLPLIFIAMVAIPEVLRRSGATRAAKGAFPGGFAGLMVTLISNSLLIGLIAALGTFVAVYLNSDDDDGSGGGKGKRRRRRTDYGYGGIGGGMSGGFGGGGGGFGGGGGSFGGGGASGSW